MTYFNWIKESIPTVDSKNHVYNGFSSVTTMLSATKDMSGLEAWRKSIGEDVADHIFREAGKNGTDLHKAIESYLNNKQDVPTRPLIIGHFLNIHDLLDNIDNIRHTEVALVSNKMKLGGTSDCIAIYKGNLSIIDFKTSRRKKQMAHIEDYFLQATIYAMMYEEMTGTPIDSLAILITCEDGAVQEFIRDTKQFKKAALERIELYHSLS